MLRAWACDGQAMYESLKDMPVARRPKSLELFPWGTPYFRAWRFLRWYLALLLPLAASAAALWLARGPVQSLVVFFGGALVAAALFVEVCSGMASSNWGTHFRQSEPVRYWLQVAVTAVGYLFLSCAGCFV